jgi:hypothetical protein
MKLLSENWKRYLNESKAYYYHITPTKNVESIMRNGLQPSIPKDMNDVEGVYLFLSVEAAEEALMNWLGDRFDEDEDLTMLKVDSSGVTSTSQKNAEYEIIANNKIEPQFVSIVGPI